LSDFNMLDCTVFVTC